MIRPGRESTPWRLSMSEMRVECYAGYRADQRPIRFILRGHIFEIKEVQDRWYSPGAVYFRVRAEDGDYFVLRHDEAQDVWSLDAFRSARERPPLPEAGEVAES
jgi:hypothetical protein